MAVTVPTLPDHFIVHVKEVQHALMNGQNSLIKLMMTMMMVTCSVVRRVQLLNLNALDVCFYNIVDHGE